MKKINVALIGLGFGATFVNIYKEHPAVDKVYLYDKDKNVLDYVSNKSGIENKLSSFEEAIERSDVDAIHLVTPIPLHEEQTIQVLKAGKHCACTVPMATSLEGIQRIVDAAEKSGKTYMMMETTLYTDRFLHVKNMYDKGELGKIQFLRGSHYQDMSYWPDYWEGLPPMHYGTHAIAPLVALSGSRIKKVHAFGSGSMDEKLVKQYSNPFPVETAIFAFENGLKAEATRTLFETARQYQEGLFVYGSKKSFEWSFDDGGKPYITTLGERSKWGRGRENIVEAVDLPDYSYVLPDEIRHFTGKGGFDNLNPHRAADMGEGGHHGSHPYLVHEFVMSIVECRKPYIDIRMAANITAAGVCAHISAINDGCCVEIPDFEKVRK